MGVGCWTLCYRFANPNPVTLTLHRVRVRVIPNPGYLKWLALYGKNIKRKRAKDATNRGKNVKPKRDNESSNKRARNTKQRSIQEYTTEPKKRQHHNHTTQAQEDSPEQQNRSQSSYDTG